MKGTVPRLLIARVVLGKTENKTLWVQTQLEFRRRRPRYYTKALVSARIARTAEKMCT